VELLAALPLIALVAMTAWQMVVAGHGWWKLREAARVSARELHVAAGRGERPAAARRDAQRMARAVVGPSVAPSLKLTTVAGRTRVAANLPVIPVFAIIGDGPQVVTEARFVP
jgi:hypothetical protein